MPKSALAYRKLALRLWREKKEAIKKLRESERVVQKLQQSVKDLNEVISKQTSQCVAVQQKFKSWANDFSVEIVHGPRRKTKSTARKSTGARDTPVLTIDTSDSSDFESPDSDADSVDLAHERLEKRDSPKSPEPPQQQPAPEPEWW